MNGQQTATIPFEILTAAMKGEAEAATKLIAAKGLARFKWGAPAQLDVLRGLLKAEPDAEIKKLLQSAIDAPGKK